MEFKNVRDQLIKVRQYEDESTSSKLTQVFQSPRPRLDFSNHFFFTKSAKLLNNYLKSYLSSKRVVKCINLSNCRLSAKLLMKIIKSFLSSNSSTTILDISSNYLTLSTSHFEAISKLLCCGYKPKSLILKNNKCEDPLIFKALYLNEVYLKRLDLYNSSLSSEALLALSKAISLNKTIEKLDLSANPSAFENYVNVLTFSQSISENSTILSLTLNENSPLSHPEHLRQLCKGLKYNSSIQTLRLNSINLQDQGVEILFSHLFPKSPIPSLHFQNNRIHDPGLKFLLANFPKTLTSLNISYNTFNDASSFFPFCSMLRQTKSLRKLDISNCFEFIEDEVSYVEELGEAICQNDSLAELRCEGVKVSQDPDEFCNRISHAIDNRKLSLTYKISAVYCERDDEDSIKSKRFSKKIISKLPSEIWLDVDSGSKTKRKAFIDSPNQEPIFETSIQFSYTTFI